MGNLRKSSRIEAQHFISYDLLDDKGDVIHTGMAISRDLSRKGILMEERTEVLLNSPVKLHLAVKDDVVDVVGIVRHVEKVSDNVFNIGIEFSGMNDTLLNKLAESYPDILKS